MIITSRIAREHDAGSPTSDEVRAHLRVLLGRSEFDASDRRRRFLSYVVEETLAGRGDRIKAYNVALAAFNRSEDFDPQVDPIVRIEAGRLRRALELYYLTAGRSDPIRICIPKGSYAAAFAYAEDRIAVPEAPIVTHATQPVALVPAPQPAQKRRRFWPAAGMALAALALAAVATVGGQSKVEERDGLTLDGAAETSILVTAFESAGGDSAQAFVARGLMYEIIVGLVDAGDLAVFGADGGLNSNAMPSNYDYTLVGAAQSNARKVRVNALLYDSRTGRLLQSWTFDEDVQQATHLDIQAAVAGEIVHAIERLNTSDASAHKTSRNRPAMGRDETAATSAVTWRTTSRLAAYQRSVGTLYAHSMSSDRR